MQMGAGFSQRVSKITDGAMIQRLGGEGCGRRTRAWAVVGPGDMVANPRAGFPGAWLEDGDRSSEFGDWLGFQWRDWIRRSSWGWGRMWDGIGVGD